MIKIKFHRLDGQKRLTDGENLFWAKFFRNCSQTHEMLTVVNGHTAHHILKF